MDEFEMSSNARNQSVAFESASIHDTVERAFRLAYGDEPTAESRFEGFRLFKQVALMEPDTTERDEWSSIAYAQRALAECYCNGVCVSQDWRQGVEWYKRAAESGDVWACVQLGFMHSSGNLVVERDGDKAFSYFKRALSLGAEGEALHAANFGIANLYETGNGVEQDTRRSESMYRECIESGASAPIVKRVYGLYLLNRGSNEQERSFGYQLLHEAANDGDSLAQMQCATWGKDIPTIKERLSRLPKYAVQQNLELVEAGDCFDFDEWLWVAYSLWYGIGCDKDLDVASNLMSAITVDRPGVGGISVGVPELCSLMADMVRTGYVEDASGQDEKLWFAAAGRDFTPLKIFVMDCQDQLSTEFNQNSIMRHAKLGAFWANVLGESDLHDLSSEMQSMSLSNMTSSACDMRGDYRGSVGAAALALKWARRLQGEEYKKRLTESELAELLRNLAAIEEHEQIALLYMGIGYYKLFLFTSEPDKQKDALDRSIALLRQSYAMSNAIAGGVCVAALINRAESPEFSNAIDYDAREASRIAIELIEMKGYQLDELDAFDPALHLGEIVVHSAGCGCVSGMVEGGLDRALALFKLGSTRGYSSCSNQVGRFSKSLFGKLTYR